MSDTEVTSSDSDSDFPSMRVRKGMNHLQWTVQAAKDLAYLKSFKIKPTVLHSPDSESYILKFNHRTKLYFDIKPSYILPKIWTINPRTDMKKPFIRRRIEYDKYTILNRHIIPQDRISIFPFSHHILMIASKKRICDLEHNWSSRLPDNFPWPCGCKSPENSLWENDKKSPFPKSNTSGWVSEPMLKTPFEVLPNTVTLNKSSTRSYKRRKTRFSDRKGNR